MVLKTLIITQARMSSTRLPGKIFKQINGQSLLEIHINRLLKSTLADAVMIATTDNPNDEIVFNWAKEKNILCSRGSENDVLDRFYKAALPIKPKWIVRVTSDCPLIDPSLIDSVIKLAINSQKDYTANIIQERFPDGQDVEVFTFESLEKAWLEAKLDSEREHVTPYIRKNINQNGLSLFSAADLCCEQDYSSIRMTVDEEKDYNMIKKLIEVKGVDLRWEEYVKYIIDNDLMAINGNIIRNEGYLKSIKNDN